MKTIKFNGYLLPNVGACVDGVTQDEESEYIRLIELASGYKFSQNSLYLGVPEIPINGGDWYWKIKRFATMYYEILPISLATTWLKVALGEITRENWVVDIDAEKDHQRMQDFNKLYGTSTSSKWRYWGNFNGDRIRFNDNKSYIPKINLDMFFTYFYEQEAELLPDPAEPVKGDATEVSDWISVNERLPDIGKSILSYSEDMGIVITKYTTYGKGSIGYDMGDTRCWFEYVTHDNYCMEHRRVTHWMLTPNPPPSPEKLAREQAEKKADEFIHWYDNNTDPVNRTRKGAVVEYILKEKM